MDEHTLEIPLVREERLEQDAAELETITTRLGWIMRRQMHRELDSFGLTVPQFMALLCIQGSDQGCSMSELAESSHQVSATMTGIVDRLVERGWVNRQRDRRDRRALIVELTPQGKALVQHISQAKRSQAMQALAALTAEERLTMIETTRRFLAAMENAIRPVN